MENKNYLNKNSQSHIKVKVPLPTFFTPIVPLSTFFTPKIPLSVSPSPPPPLLMSGLIFSLLQFLLGFHRLLVHLLLSVP